MAEAKQPVAIRIVRPYDSAEAFTEREGDTIGKTSIVLLGAKERPTGVILRFEITINTGEAMMRGEGRVLAFKEQALFDETGLVLRYTRLDPKSKALVDRLAAIREGQMSVPQTPAEAPTSNPQSVEVASSDPLPQTPSTPEIEAAAADAPPDEDQDAAGTDPPPPGADEHDVTTDAPEAADPTSDADEQAMDTPVPDAVSDARDSVPPAATADEPEDAEGPATDPPPTEDVEVEVSMSEPPPSISIEVELVDDDATTDEAYVAAEAEAAPAPLAEATPASEPPAEATPPAPTPTSAPPAAASQDESTAPASEEPGVAAAAMPEPLATTPNIEAPASLNELPDEVPTRSREVSEMTREALLEKLRRRGERLGTDGVERILASSPNRAG